MQRRLAERADQMDLVLRDLIMPGSHGLLGLLLLLANHPTVPVAVVSATEAPAVIRHALGLAGQTVKQHVSLGFRKIGVSNRAQAEALLARLGIKLSPAPERHYRSIRCSLSE